jgi:N-acetylglutamate synthase
MSDAFSNEQVFAMEVAAARAWPAGRVIEADGWRVRLSGGGSRRANSVLPLAFSGSDIGAAIMAVEAHYRGQKTRCYFQVTSIAEPDHLDATLEARGYAYEEPCLLMAKRLSVGAMPGAMPGEMPVDVVVTDEPSAAWMSVYAETLDPVRAAAAPAVLASVPHRRAFLLVMRDGAPLSSALAVVSPDGNVLVECVATRSAVRRAGAAQMVMNALEAWAAQNGAHTSVLQVIAGNAPARALYRGCGYAEVGRYHYRWRDVG